MSWSNIREKDKKDYCFRLAFNANFDRTAALKLAQGTFPDTEYDEVDRAYKSFHSEKEFVARQKRKKEIMKNRATLEEIPVDLLGKILESSSTETQSSLHRTSHAFSNFVEGTFKTYELVQVYLGQDTIESSAIEQKSPVHETLGVGQKRKRPNDDEKATNETPQSRTIPETLEFLKEIFNEPNLKIKKLAIKSPRSDDETETQSEFFSGLQNILKALKNRIYIEILDLAVPNTEYLMTMLDAVKVGHLTKLSIDDIKSGTPVDIKDSSHWLHIEDFFSGLLDVNLSPQQVYHMRTARFRSSTITIDDILKFRDMLIQNLKPICVRFPCGLNTNEVIEALKPFIPSKELSQKSRGSYLCVGGQKLQFSICPYFDYEFIIK